MLATDDVKTSPRMTPRSRARVHQSTTVTEFRGGCGSTRAPLVSRPRSNVVVDMRSRAGTRSVQGPQAARMNPAESRPRLRSRGFLEDAASRVSVAVGAFRISRTRARVRCSPARSRGSRESRRSRRGPSTLRESCRTRQAPRVATASRSAHAATAVLVPRATRRRRLCVPSRCRRRRRSFPSSHRFATGGIVNEFAPPSHRRRVRALRSRARHSLGARASSRTARNPPRRTAGSRSTPSKTRVSHAFEGRARTGAAHRETLGLPRPSSPPRSRKLFFAYS